MNPTASLIDTRLIETVLNATALGIVALIILFVFIITVLIIRDKRREREVVREVELAQEESQRQRDEATQERERAFFASIESVKETTEAIRTLADSDAKRAELTSEMVRTLKTINTTMQRMGDGQDAILTHQIGFEQTLAGGVSIGKQMLAKLVQADANIAQALDILRRLEAQMGVSNHAIVQDSDQQVLTEETLPDEILT